MTRVVPRAVFVAIGTLVAIAIGFFLPPLVSERGYPVASPFADPDKITLAYYSIVAALLLITAFAALRGHAPRRLAWVVALVGVAMSSALQSLILVAPLTLTHDYPILIGVAAVLIGTATFVVVAWQRRGWDRWLCLLGGFAFASLSYGCPLIMGMFGEVSGGVVFLVADLVLLASAVPSLLGLRT